MVQLSERNGRGRSGGVGFIESSRGGRGAGISNVDVSIRDICKQPLTIPVTGEEWGEHQNNQGAELTMAMRASRTSWFWRGQVRTLIGRGGDH